MILAEATAGSMVGGSLSESMKVLQGRRTFPALSRVGKPATPVTASWGLQVLLRRSSVRSLATGPAPSTHLNCTRESKCYNFKMYRKRREREKKGKNLIENRLAKHLSGRLGLGPDFLGELNVESLVHLAGLGVLQAGEDVAEDAEGRRDNATARRRKPKVRKKKKKGNTRKKKREPGVSGVDSLMHDFNLEGGTEHSPERGGQPKLRAAQGKINDFCINSNCSTEKKGT